MPMVYSSKRQLELEYQAFHAAFFDWQIQIFLVLHSVRVDKANSQQATLFTYSPPFPPVPKPPSAIS